MKKTIFLTLMLAITATILFGQVFLDEGFTEEAFPPAGWTLGPDSPGRVEPWHNWSRGTGGTSGPMARSYSWDDDEVESFEPNHWLVTPTINLGTAPAALLFDVMTNTYDNEHLTIYVSTLNNGATLSALLSDFDENGTTLDAGFVTNTAYATRRYSLADFSEQTIRIAFRHSQSQNEDGFFLYLDNIKVMNVFNYDLEATLLVSNVPLSGIDHNGGTQAAITATITNVGLASATGYTVTLRRPNAIDPVHVWDAGTAIAAGGFLQYTHTYMPPIGNAMLYFTVEFGTDEDISNNTSNNISILVFDGSTSSFVNPIGYNVTAPNDQNYSSITPAGITNVPFDWGSWNGIVQTLYLREGAGTGDNQPAELGGTGSITITGLSYWAIWGTGGLTAGVGEVKIYLGATNQTSFTSNTNWVPIVGNQQLVWEGNASAVIGSHQNNTNGAEARFNFDVPFVLPANQNLVVTTIKVGGTYYNAPNYTWFRGKTLTAAQGGQNRAIYVASSSSEILESNIPAASGTIVNTVPVIRLYTDTTAMVTLYGEVYEVDGTTPIEGVTIGRLDTPSVTVVTNALGEYEYPAFKTTNNGIFAYKSGYTVFNSSPLTDTDDEYWYYLITLQTIPLRTVTGTVKAGYNSSVQSGVTVTFNHPLGATYPATTIGDGTFTVEVPENTTYTVTIPESPVFQAFTRTVAIGGANQSIADILLIERPLPAISLRAAFVPGNDDDIPDAYDVEWVSPHAKVTTHSHMSTTYNGGYNLGGGDDFIAFIRFNRADMITDIANGNTRDIYRVAFMPNVAPPIATYEVVIMSFPDAIPGTPTLGNMPAWSTGLPMYIQPIPDYQITAGAWNYVDLDELVDLTANTLGGQVWIGIHVLNTDTSLYPLRGFTRSNSSHPYLGDFIYYPDGEPEYYSWSTNASPVGDWCLAAYSVDTPASSDGAPMLATRNYSRKMRAWGNGPSSSSHMASFELDSSTVEPLININSYNTITRDSDYRSVSGYELYRVPIALQTNQSAWGSPVTTANTSYPSTIDNAPMVPWVYAVVAVYNSGTPAYLVKSAPIFSRVLGPVSGSVTIAVLDEDGNPLGNGDLTIVMTHGSHQDTQITDPVYDSVEDIYVFDEIPYGIYNIVVTGTGFQPNSKAVAVYSDVETEITLLPGSFLWGESFEGSDFPPTGWLNFDVDNDEYAWRIDDQFGTLQQIGYHGNLSVYSESYCTEAGQQACLYPDNWLISPVLNLNQINTYTLSYALRSAGRVVNNERIQVYAIWTPLTDVNAFRTLLEELGDVAPGSEDYFEGITHWTYKGLDDDYGDLLDDFTTQTQNWSVRTKRLDIAQALEPEDLANFRIAFRHWASFDNHYLMLDDIRITADYITTATITGLVEADDPAGALQGASVLWSRVGADPAETDTETTDASGGYQIEDAVIGGNYQITASMTGYKNEQISFTVQNTPSIPTITLHKLYNISGFVYDGATGTTPLVGAVVAFMQGDPLVAVATTPATGATGAYDAVQLTAGVYTVKVTYTSNSISYVWTGSHTVTADNATVNFNVAPPEMFTITGKFGYMVSDTFTGISGATVNFANVLGASGYSPANVTTSAEADHIGEYTIETEEGEYNVTITGAIGTGIVYEFKTPTGEPQEVTETVPGFPQKVGTPKTFTITGKTGYMAGDTFTVLGGVAVSYTNVAGGTPITAVSSTTEGSVGEFSITVPSGLYNISITGTAGAINYALTSASTLVAADATSHPNVTMTAVSYNISGVVKKNMVGNPLFAGATVKLVDTTTPTTIFTAEAATGANGEYSILSVVPGTYTVRVTFTQDGEQTWDRTAPFVVPTDGTTLEIIVAHALTGEDIVELPTVTVLKANYPNPFNPSTTIAFDMAQAGNVSIEVYNIKGQKVKTLVDGDYGVGRHSVVWNGDDASGRNVGSGIYFYRMTTSGYSSIQKMLLMK